MQFLEALQYLLSLGHETVTMKLGLRNSQLLLEALDNPQKKLSALQIAGTNGKGSTAAFVDSILRTAGIRTGLYTSPHLISITERIKIGGREISADNFAELATEVRDAAEGLVRDKKLDAYPTFFEQLTAIALLTFARSKVELAILETGMGGRLDATTCAQAHTVAITPIDLDHEEHLGDTIEKVAAEKTAIIRPGVTAVIAPQSNAASEVIRKRCELTEVTPVFAETSVRLEDSTRDGRFCVSLQNSGNAYKRVWLGLRGRHQIVNVSLAVAVVEALRAKGLIVPRAAIIQGIEMATHPGRLEVFKEKPAFLLDGAHNPAGAQALRNYLDEFAYRPLTLIFGAMRDKRLERMAETLFPVADQVIITQVDNERTAKLEVLEKLAASLVEKERLAATQSLKEAITVAREKTEPRGLVCVTGSLYLVGEAKGQLQRAKEVAGSI